MSAMAFRARKPRGQVHLSVTPLIDVLFLLLIFFMLTGTFKRFGELELTLPSSETAQAGTDEGPAALEVVATEDGRLLLDGDPIALDALGARLGELRTDDPDGRIVLKAESEVVHGRVVALLDLIRDAGYPGVSISTEVPRSGDPAAARNDRVPSP
jgi:biopolymer transport protein ExbD